MSAHNQERLTYRIPEAAALIGISESGLRRQIRAGHVPVIRIGRRALISRTTVERMVAEPAAERCLEHGDRPAWLRALH